MGGKVGNQPKLFYNPDEIASEIQLAQIAFSLGASKVRGLSAQEDALFQKVPSDVDSLANKVFASIQRGEDPLGEAFCALRSPLVRRSSGAVYTPSLIVNAMVQWASAHAQPDVVVDPGVGSARFLIAAAKLFPGADLIGIDTDPLAALVSRAHIAALGLSSRATISLLDYRDFSRPEENAGRCLYLGNPPYVRHHGISPQWKAWLASSARGIGHMASQLAGLHVHFFLATAKNARPGDYGAFITSAEWLDVNYGKLVRDLFLTQLGGLSIHLVDPTAMPFPDAATTAAVTCFEVGSKAKSIRLSTISKPAALLSLPPGKSIKRDRLEAATRWTPIVRSSNIRAPQGYIELGELCSVHRGQVTGLNRVWIHGSHSPSLPDAVLFPSITKARDLFQAGERLKDSSILRRVVDLPVDLDVYSVSERRVIMKFLSWARTQGADLGYVARNRKAWWSVGLRSPAPILATYMARRAPVFVRNLADARHINIAHGLYPREQLHKKVLDTLAAFLTASVSISQGRTYAGGLTKFEPREMERLFIPEPNLLMNHKASDLIT
jgi:hypothetical protein